MACHTMSAYMKTYKNVNVFQNYSAGTIFKARHKIIMKSCKHNTVSNRNIFIPPGFCIACLLAAAGAVFLHDEHWKPRPGWGDQAGQQRHSCLAPSPSTSTLEKASSATTHPVFTFWKINSNLIGNVFNCPQRAQPYKLHHYFKINFKNYMVIT